MRHIPSFKNGPNKNRRTSIKVSDIRHPVWPLSADSTGVPRPPKSFSRCLKSYARRNRSTPSQSLQRTSISIRIFTVRKLIALIQVSYCCAGNRSPIADPRMRGSIIGLELVRRFFLASTILTAPRTLLLLICPRNTT